MVVRVKFSALKQGSWYEYLVRFALGGLVTVVAGVVADIWGPAASGSFLAFPAISCASATLIEKHERQRKERRRLKGKERGKNAAALDIAGTVLGSAGLAAFGTVIWLLAEKTPGGSLARASAMSFATSVLLWHLRRVMRFLKT